MATVKKGTLTESPQWWKHLRDWKRVYWKRERQAAKRDATTAEEINHPEPEDMAEAMVAYGEWCRTP